MFIFVYIYLHFAINTLKNYDKRHWWIYVNIYIFKFMKKILIQFVMWPQRHFSNSTRINIFLEFLGKSEMIKKQNTHCNV